MKKISWKQIITVLAAVLMITVNALANALPINNKMTGDISDQFAIYFVPAGYVFSIWGLIYLGVVVYTIFQVLPAQKDNALLNKIAPAFWVSSLANTAWIFAWHYELFALTVPLMIIILGSLIYIFNQISEQKDTLSMKETLMVKIPFSIYLGWISVATIANISQLLYFYGWNGFGLSGQVWAVILLIVATVLGLIMLARENDAFFVAVLVWAFIGIAIKQANAPLVVNTAYITAGLLAVGMIGFPLFRAFKK